MNRPESARQNICDLDDLPALPGVAIQILEKIRTSETSLHSLAEILAADPALSVKVLNFVNSPFFGLSRNITNLPHAVSLLGENWLKYIALSFSLVNVFGWEKIRFDYSLFWRHSLEIAVVSRLLAKAIGRQDTEDMYFLGLIHDMGILAMVHCHPEQYALVLDQMKDSTKIRHVVEKEIFAANHMEVGAALVEAWGLPEIYILPILNHHCPENIPQEDTDALTMAQILFLAREISWFLHSEDKTTELYRINEFLNKYGMEDIDLHSIVEGACGQINPLINLFNIDHQGRYDYALILEESKKELYRLSLSMVQQMREQEQTIDNLNVLAYQDSLTKLLNYRRFKEYLDDLLETSRSHGSTNVVALADLDEFKTINDRYGHIAGDHVLQEVSRFLKNSIRETDIVARYGGEEFAFIMIRTSIEEGFEIMERLRDQLSKLRIEFQGQLIHITMSVGVTSFSAQSIISARNVIRQADTAMYLSKNRGKNRTMIHNDS